MGSSVTRERQVESLQERLPTRKYLEDLERLRKEKQEEQKRQKQLQKQNTAATEKCYDLRDSTLTFVDEEDDHDFECVGYKSKRAQMSCGHTVTPMSLTQWSQMQLDEGKTGFECASCPAVWPFEEVCKMALLTEAEKKTFEDKLFHNVIFKEKKAKLCPACSSIVIREDPHKLCVRCSQCSVVKGKTYEFCWQCLKEWKGQSTSTDRCDNVGCKNEALETLRTCPYIEFNEMKDVTGCPSVRACPTCGKLLEHDRTGCKNITCPDCKVQFCFVCLKTTKECTNTSSYSMPCSVGIAPRQTSIPVKNRS